MRMRLNVVCENTVGRPIPATGEHGFACLVEYGDRTWLFDTGQGKTLLSNLDVLGLEPAKIEAIILSHGHYDHVGGLPGLLTRIGPRPVHAHPDIFQERYWQGQHERRSIGMPCSRQDLEDAGARFCLHGKLTRLAPGLFFSGEIPRRTAVEIGDPHLVVRKTPDDPYTADVFRDDAALAIETDRGLVILLGCAHAGLINTVRFFLDQLNAPPVYAIVGGTHLGPANDAQFAETLDFLDQLNVARLGLAHCTGQTRAAQLHARFPSKVFFASVGSKLEV